jgi:uncharacterized membrane protein
MSIQSAVESRPAAGSQRALSRLWAAPHVGGVGVLTTLIAVIYAGFSLVLYRTFRESSYDLVIFDQAVRSYAHFHLGISIIKGVHNGFGPHFSLLGDHFSPILATLAPLYWIYDGPQTLLVAQGVLFALAIPPLWVFTRRAFGGSGRKATISAYLICVAYGLSWPLATAAAFDFHEVAFAPVLTAIALERIQAGRLRSALIALAILLLVKEDMGLMVAGIGFYLVISLTQSVPRQRTVGIILMAAGVAYSAFATYVLIPAFGGRADYYWAYSTLGNDVLQVIGHVIRHPLSSLRMMFTPGVKVSTMTWLVGVFCFLPLLSPIVVAALPLLAERMLNSRYNNWWVPHFQYNAYLVVILVCAAVDGAARLDRWATRARAYLAARHTSPEPVARVLPAAAADQPEPIASVPPAAAHTNPRIVTSGVVVLICSLAICAAALYSVPQFPLGQALHAQFYRRSSTARAAAAADAAVPSGVLVEAANSVGPELSGRDTVLLWDGEHPPLGSPWIVADVRNHEMTFANRSAQRARVALLLRDGYHIVFSRRGYLVLHRASPPSPLGGSA